MATLAEVKAIALRLLDEEITGTVEDELIVDGVRAALDEILPWVPKLKTVTIAGGKVTEVLPADFYAAEAIVSSDGDSLPKGRLLPGDYFGESSTPNAWLLFPSGSISFAKALDDDVTLYYLAQWTKPDGSDTEATLEPPDYATHAICLYTAAYMMLPDATSIAELRQFNTRIDSGNPEHNPRHKMVEFFLKLFKENLNRIPKYQRVGE